MELLRHSGREWRLRSCWSLVILLLVTLLSACAELNGNVPPVTKVVTRVETIPVTREVVVQVTATPWVKPFEPPYTDLVGTYWVLKAVAVDGVATLRPEGSRYPWISFPNETDITGNDGCNDFGPWGMTAMLCVSTIHGSESSDKMFRRTFGSRTSYGIRDGELRILYSADKHGVLIFRPYEEVETEPEVQPSSGGARGG